MQDFMNAPLWQKAVAVALIICALSWLCYSYVYRPKLVEIKDLRTKLKDIDLEMTMILGEKVVLKKGQEKVALLQKELEEMMKKIPTEQEVPFLLNQFISEIGKGLNIEYTAIEPKDLAKEGNYKILPLQVSFNSDYPIVTSYLSQLKSLPSTIRVDNLIIRRTLGSQAQPAQLEIGMNLSAFVMPGKAIKNTESEARPPLYFANPFEESQKAAVKPDGTQKKKISETGLILQGLWKGKETKVFINDKMVGIGDSVDGYKLISIKEDKVVVQKGGKRYTLPLGGK